VNWWALAEFLVTLLAGLGLLVAPLVLSFLDVPPSNDVSPT
jgi:hypothetical protein